jgi:hypothetical protein
MKMRDDNPLDLIVSEHEVITLLVVKSIGLAEFVNFSLNGTAFPGTKPKAEPCVFPVQNSGFMGVTVHYVEDSGGSFAVQATGSGGGDIAVHARKQANTEAFKTIVYRLSLE